MARSHGRMLLMLAALAASMPMATSPAASPPAPSYSITHLGNLGGPGAVVGALNDTGDAVGYSVLPNGSFHAFIHRDGKMIDLGTFGGLYSIAYGINASRQVVGVVLTNTAVPHAFLWQDGKVTDLNSPGSAGSFAAAINDSGEVVGAAIPPGGAMPHASIWRPGQPVVDLGTAGGILSVANAINAEGDVVGYAMRPNGSRFAVIWEDGQARALPGLGGVNSTVTDINDLGEIIGQAQTAAGQNHACLWRDGVAIDLNPTGSSTSIAMGINDAGEVVGQSAAVPAGSGATIASVTQSGARISQVGLLTLIWDIDTTAIIRASGTGLSPTDRFADGAKIYRINNGGVVGIETSKNDAGLVRPTGCKHLTDLQKAECANAIAAIKTHLSDHISQNPGAKPRRSKTLLKLAGLLAAAQASVELDPAIDGAVCETVKALKSFVRVIHRKTPDLNPLADQAQQVIDKLSG